MNEPASRTAHVAQAGAEPDGTERLRACDALALHRDDNVATALQALPAGMTARVAGGGSLASVRLRESIALCHKFALCDLAQGAVITKYGESIGRAARPIRAGEHVHTHNLKSNRAS